MPWHRVSVDPPQLPWKWGHMLVFGRLRVHLRCSQWRASPEMHRGEEAEEKEGGEGGGGE